MLYGAFGTFRGKFDESSARGEVVDADGLAESGIDATGTMAYLILQVLSLSSAD